MTVPDGPPPDHHRAGRQARLLVFLRAATVATIVLSAVTVLVPDAVGRAAGAGVVTILVAVPLLRVAWLAQRWARKGDWLFATVACLLLGIVATAALVG
jgi:hypothetical protein